MPSSSLWVLGIAYLVYTLLIHSRAYVAYGVTVPSGTSGVGAVLVQGFATVFTGSYASDHVLTMEIWRDGSWNSSTGQYNRDGTRLTYQAFPGTISFATVYIDTESGGTSSLQQIPASPSSYVGVAVDYPGSGYHSYFLVVYNANYDTTFSANTVAGQFSLITTVLDK